jgi:hypothetical protein
MGYIIYNAVGKLNLTNLYLPMIILDSNCVIDIGLYLRYLLLKGIQQNKTYITFTDNESNVNFFINNTFIYHSGQQYVSPNKKDNIRVEKFSQFISVKLK